MNEVAIASLKIKCELQILKPSTICRILCIIFSFFFKFQFSWGVWAKRLQLMKPYVKNKKIMLTGYFELNWIFG